MILIFVFFFVRFFENLGDDEEVHPCPDFFDTCCSLKQDTIVKPKTNPSIVKTDKCGIRNKNGAIFNVIEHDNEAQYGELMMESLWFHSIQSFELGIINNRGKNSEANL